METGTVRYVILLICASVLFGALVQMLTAPPMIPVTRVIEGIEVTVCVPESAQ